MSANSRPDAVIRLGDLVASGFVQDPVTGKLRFTGAGTTIGDVKDSAQTADHLGWIKLDGRPVSSLTAVQQANAASLGFTANLPNAEEAVSRQKTGSTLGSVSGSNTVVLTQENLPIVDLTSTDSGAHDHGIRFKHSYAAVGSGTGDQPWSGGGWSGVDGAGYFDVQPVGNHTHVVSLGGSNTPVDISPKTIYLNKFMYLGQ